MIYLLSVFSSLLLVVAAYGIKRYFDDRMAARAVVSGISETLEKKLAECIGETSANTGLVRERLTIFEKALGNAISQFADIVKETRVSELDSRAKTAGQILRPGRRMLP